MDNTHLVSKKMQSLCLDIFNLVANSNSLTADKIYQEYNFLPKPLVHLAINILCEKKIIHLDPLSLTYITNKHYPPNTFPPLTCHPYGAPYQLFKQESFKSPYHLPISKTITFKELTLADYLAFHERYNYESISMDGVIGDEFFLRQFATVLHDKTGEKRTHTYIAQTLDDSILGLITITNHTNRDCKFHRLPLLNNQIFDVTFIETRTTFQNQGIATNLLSFAIKDIMQKEDLKLLTYNPICDESLSVMKKVFSINKFEIIDHNKLPLKEFAKYGLLSGYIIKPIENTLENDDNEKI